MTACVSGHWVTSLRQVSVLDREYNGIKMSNTTHMPQFDKLTSADNFSMWKLQMAAYLQIYKLMAIVDGTTQRPAEAKAQEIWDTNDALAKLAILTVIDAGQREYVCSAKTSAMM